MQPLKSFLTFFVLCFFIIFLNACSDGNSSDEPKAALTGEKFTTKAVELFKNADFSNSNPDGSSDSDGDSKSPDVNDSVIIIKTIQQLGYQVKETTISGLLNNFYTDKGYKFENHMADEKKSFSYTEPTKATPDDLKNSKWDKLAVGDIIFNNISSDPNDEDWMNAMIYIGAYNGITHAVFLASDYHGDARVVDLEDPSEASSHDIKNNIIKLRKLKYSSFL